MIDNIEKKIKLIISSCENKDIDIVAILKDFPDNERSIEDIAEDIDNIVEELRNYYINNNDFYQFEGNYSDSIKESINNLVRKTLLVYDAFSIIRNIVSENVNLAIEILDEYFDQCILRRDPEFKSSIKYVDENISRQEQIAFMNGYSALVYDCVGKLLGENAIKKAIESNTKLDSILINYISQKINVSFKELRLNFITRSLQYLV